MGFLRFWHFCYMANSFCYTGKNLSFFRFSAGQGPYREKYRFSQVFRLRSRSPNRTKNDAKKDENTRRGLYRKNPRFSQVAQAARRAIFVTLRKWWNARRTIRTRRHAFIFRKSHDFEKISKRNARRAIACVLRLVLILVAIKQKTPVFDRGGNYF